MYLIVKKLKNATVCSTKHVFVNYCNKGSQAIATGGIVTEASYITVASYVHSSSAPPWTHVITRYHTVYTVYM